MPYALISVSDKANLDQLVPVLKKYNITALSTGGTFKKLVELEADVIEISQYTDYPESPDGLVKSLHPKIHFGILMDTNKPEHQKYAKEHDIYPIDFVVVNLYPFEKIAEDDESTIEDLQHNIDIGGVTMIRAAAKNWFRVTTITDPKDYSRLAEELEEGQGQTSELFKEKLAVKAFNHTLKYDGKIHGTLSARLLDSPALNLSFSKGRILRYGENWHQKGAFYADSFTQEANIGHYKQHHGKALSFNNFVDGNAALEACKGLPSDRPGVVIVKHTIQCGIATGPTLAEAFKKAWAGDPISSFGGVIAFNQKLDLPTAKLLKGKFIELVIAPEFEPEALDHLVVTLKKKFLRILEVGPFGRMDPAIKIYKTVLGGILEQDRDLELYSEWEEVTEAKFDTGKQELAKFAIHCSKHIKSNASVIVREYQPGYFQLLGVGSGQPNRVDTLEKLAYPKAIANIHREHEELGIDEPLEDYAQKIIAECVYASEAFFPFRDTIDAAARMGIHYVVQPGGSKRDQDSIDAANEHGIAMVFTRMRHFMH